MNSLTPKMLAELPTSDRAAVALAFGQSLPPVFGYAAILLAAAFVLTLFLPERELRTSAHSDAGQGRSNPQPPPPPPRSPG